MKKFKTRTYVLDEESIKLLEEFAEVHKSSLSTALRMIITLHCKGGYE